MDSGHLKVETCAPNYQQTLLFCFFFIKPYCSVYFVPVLLDYFQSHVLAHIILICTEHGAMSLCSGEWVNEWDVQNASQYEYQKFGRAQLDVYANATFGWSYWTLKNDMIHWDFEWNIQNKYLLFSKYTGHAKPCLYFSSTTSMILLLSHDYG